MKCLFLLFLLFWEMNLVSTCLLTLPSGVAIRVEKGQVEEENGDLFEWDFCEGIDSPGSDCDGALICQTTSQGIQRSFGSRLHFNQTDVVTMTLTGGKSCETIERKIEVRLYCDDSKPVVVELSPCNYLLVLRSSTFCIPVKSKQIEIQEKLEVLQQKIANSQSQKAVEDQKNKTFDPNICNYPPFKDYGDMTFNLLEVTYIANLCEQISGCQGGYICQLLPNGGAKSLGTGPLVYLGNNQFRVSNGTIGCGGKERSSLIELPRNCFSLNPTIILAEEIEDCEYKIVLGDRSCRPNMTLVLSKRQQEKREAEEWARKERERKKMRELELLPVLSEFERKKGEEKRQNRKVENKEKSEKKNKKETEKERLKEIEEKKGIEKQQSTRTCRIEPIERPGVHSKCHPGNFGCTEDGMWVSGQCSGKFRCNGRTVICYPFSRHCGC